jgi:hypothetical protein
LFFFCRGPEYTKQVAWLNPSLRFRTPRVVKDGHATLLLLATPRNLFVSLFIRSRCSLVLGATFVNFILTFLQNLPRHFDTSSKPWSNLRFFLKHPRTRRFFFNYLLNLPSSEVRIVARGSNPGLYTFLLHLARLRVFRSFFFRPSVCFGLPPLGGRASVKKKIKKKFFMK